MKNHVLTLTALILISCGVFAEQHEQDSNTKSYNNGTPTHNNLNSQNEPMQKDSVQLNIFKNHSLNIKKMGQTGGYDFSRDSLTNNSNSHYRNHR
ncbi:hypothetical protein QNE88_002572 [Vibrio alginolyticus]|nr:hypothetical protein [Vibrio alginolyticus]